MLFFAVIIASFGGAIFNAIFGRYVGSGMVGAGAGLLGYILSGVVAALVIGVVAFLISLLTGAFPRGRGWGSGGGWSSGGGSGSSGGWSSGDSGGGFSGGGGDFGGGGASGSW